MKHILVVSDNNEAINKIRSSFKKTGVIETRDRIETTLKPPASKRFDLIFIDAESSGKTSGNGDLQDKIQSLKNHYPGVETIIMASKVNIGEAVKAVRSGGSHYITYPIDPVEIMHVTDCIREQAFVRSELNYLREEFWQSDALEIVRTRNPGMKKVYEQTRSVAPTRTTVLLCGETGTGKGVLASLIHHHSNRDKGRFISVHCGAIPDTLLESELFGHEKGAFTGAFKRKLGKFEIAAKGTIFLDEISTITPSAQIKLLQVLQDGTFSRVGGEEILKTDARFIAATNMDLKKMCDDGMFRKDLYYRLNVFPIEIPSLRERTEDIELLADTFIKRFNVIMQKRIKGIHPDIIKAMAVYSWPGNIRELENLMERAFILETTPELTPESFPAEFFNYPKKSEVLKVNTALPLAQARRKANDEFESQFIRQLLAKNKGRVNKSAEDAGISTRQFHKLMVKYHIQKKDYKT